MSRRSGSNFGFFLPLLAALLLVIAVSCGGAAAPTTAPQAQTVAPEAEPEAEAEVPAAEEETAAPEGAAPTATPVPVAEVAVDTPPEAETTGAEPQGTFNLAHGVLGRFSGHTRYVISGEAHALTAITTHEGLFTVDADSRFQPLMVEEWSIAPDERVWTFKIKKGIEFHKGWGEVRPEDIINTYREIGADDGGCGCAQVALIFDNPDGYFIGLDNYTLELDSGIPSFETLGWLISPGYGRVFSKKQWDTLRETLDEFEAASQLVGTGPFELTEDMSTEEWNFSAVRDHWRKTPEFAELKILLTIPEESTARWPTS